MKPASLLQQLVQGDSSGRAIRKFIKRYDLVYFGKVDHRYDDHAVVRGVTASARHTDHHFAVGNINGRDVSILERSNTVSFPGKGSRQYTWVILQVDLNRRLEMPPIFIDGQHHDEVFYANLFTNFANFRDAKTIFSEHDPLFNKRCKIFAPFDRFDDVAHFLTSEVTTMLAHHFSHFDYEFREDMIFVYNSNPTTQMNEIERMSKIGLWLAETLEKIK